MLAFQILSLGTRAAPDVIISKFLYELKWSIYCALIAILSLVAMFMVPALIIFAPVSLAAAASAHSLGTLHSMLRVIGLADGYRTDYLISEIIKTSFVRGMAFAIIFAIVALVLWAGYGYDYLAVLFSDYKAFFAAEELRFESGKLPAFIVGLGVFGLFTIAMEAVLAVPMAAAAYAIGPTDRTFNGFWGLGYRWMPILGAWLMMGLALLVFAGIGLDLLTEEFEIRSVLHLLASYVTGTPPDLESYPLRAPMIDSDGAEIVMILLIIFGCWLPPFLYAATCAIVFRERLALQEAEDEANRPTKEDHAARAKMRLGMARSLRQSRAREG
jgi:hypothetical protein